MNYGMNPGFEDELAQILENDLLPVLEPLLIILLVIVGVALIFALAGWIMRSIALTHLGKRRGVKAPWLVWLPIVGCWTIGALADEYDGRNGLKRRWRILLLVCSILAFAINSSSFGGFAGNMTELALMGDAAVTDEFIIDAVNSLIGLYASLFVYYLVVTVQLICTYICLYKVYESTLPRHAVLCFILSFLLPLAEAICLLVAMNKGYPEEQESLPAAQHPAPEAQGWYES